MPELISVEEFIAETLEDYSSPTTSSFTTKMTSCRNTVNNIEEVWKTPFFLLALLYKIASHKYRNANATFGGFSGLALLQRLKSMLHNINFFLDSLVKGDLKEVKGIEKEKRELAKQYGMVRTEVSGGEIAEELEKERRMFQLQMCEVRYQLYNTVQTTAHAQLHVFQCHNIGSYICPFVCVHSDEEKRQLCSLRDQLKPALQPELKEDSLSRQTVYSMHQLQGNKQYGTEKSGYLYKKSDGLRKMWQKRKCSVHNCYLTIAHGTPNKPPAKLNLLTCQVKPSLEDKKCFDLISHNRTYHFLAEDEPDCMAWISVLTNSKQEALNVALDERKTGGESSVEDLTRSITEDILRMPGNNVCCDCRAPDPTWISTNLGILTCIECSGIHREMGVHHSRIQSLSLDKLGTSELLLARNVGNSGFNEIVEASLPSPSLKPSAESDMAERKDFILAKYLELQFAQRSGSSPDTLRRRLQEAVHSRDIFSLLQLYAEKLDLSLPLPGLLQRETALHLAVLLADRTSLHMVDFLVHNCNNLDAQTVRGNTALHYCCLHNKTECLKLLLRAKANTHIKNENGETALDIARRLKNTHCEELIQQSQNNQFNMHIHVEYEWRLRQDDLYESDDDLDDKSGPVKKDRSSRPFSLYHSGSQERGSGGIFSVGRRLALGRGEHKREAYCSPSPQTRSLDSPPPPPPSSPAPPLPPRARGEKQFLKPSVCLLNSFEFKFMKKYMCLVMSLHSFVFMYGQAYCSKWLPPAKYTRLTGVCAKPRPDVFECVFQIKPKLKRVKAMYDCVADHHDELTFNEGEVLVVLTEEDADWWVSNIVKYAVSVHFNPVSAGG
uniref:Un-named sa1614 n=1 Tax=Pygocentrus nattereri TaxID=42514 RepID=A0AAR2ISS9_PYGNA